MSSDGASSTPPKQVGHQEKSFKAGGLVPDILDEAPPGLISVQYGDVSVQLGDEVLQSRTQTPPTAISYTASQDKLYTLMMTDPDAPSRPIPLFRSILHWMIINIPGKDISSGETVCSYVGVGAPPFSGFHRYVFVLFEQKKKLTTVEPFGGRFSRMRFDVRRFAAEHNLGKPIAGNFYLSQYERRA